MGQTVKRPKPGNDSAGTTEADVEVRRKRRLMARIHLEDSGMRAVEEGAAANKRARERVAAPAPRSPEATEVAPRDGPNRARPAGAAVRAVRPVRHPLLHVPHHVEDSQGRLAARSG